MALPRPIAQQARRGGTPARENLLRPGLEMLDFLEQADQFRAERCRYKAPVTALEQDGAALSLQLADLFA